MQFNYIADRQIDIKSLLIENNFSLTQISALLKSKNLLVNDKVYTNFNLNAGDKLTVILPDEETSVQMVEGEINIVYEDEFFLVINKPKGLSVIPSKAHFKDNLSSFVLAYFKRTNQKVGIHVVNRLDLLTSGLVVFAKSQYVHSLMGKVKIEKKYHCTVCGKLLSRSGVIEKKIKKVDNSIKRVISLDGQSAKTEYHVLSEGENFSFLDISLHTGRTHQIRVHFASIGHPLKGDTLYGNDIDDTAFDLCSYSIAFTFPLNNKHYKISLD